MAKPRVFISSTYYDLRQVRADIERFVKECGYEPVRSETGSIPYGKEERPEEYAYREIELCDIVVSIIGGRFGTESQQERGHSISQKELKRALDRGIPVFIFIEKGVHAEYSTYRSNKANLDVKYAFVDDPRIYEFIESIHALPCNNPIAPFETSQNIVEYLRAQWAGLFQRFLKEQERQAELKTLEEMKTVAATLQQLVGFLTKDRSDKDEAIRSILMANHPAFRRFAQLTNTPYRVFFMNRRELDAWLKARGWSLVESEFLDSESKYEWLHTTYQKYLKLKEDIFDSAGSLKIYTTENWNDEWLSIEKAEPQEITMGLFRSESEPRQ